MEIKYANEIVLDTAQFENEKKDLGYFREALYKTDSGKYYLKGEGGPLSKYAAHGRPGITSGRKKIPLTLEEAKAWVKENSTADVYLYAFGEPMPEE